jgi:hypothetical protein
MEVALKPGHTIEKYPMKNRFNPCFNGYPPQSTVVDWDERDSVSPYLVHHLFIPPHLRNHPI